MRQRPTYGFAPEPVPRYTGVAIALHWLMAIAIIGMLGIGLWMTELKTSPTKIEVYTWHKWIGLTILASAALRLVLRAYRHPAANVRRVDSGVAVARCHADPSSGLPADVRDAAERLAAEFGRRLSVDLVRYSRCRHS